MIHLKSINEQNKDISYKVDYIYDHLSICYSYIEQHFNPKVFRMQRITDGAVASKHRIQGLPENDLNKLYNYLYNLFDTKFVNIYTIEDAYLSIEDSYPVEIIVEIFGGDKHSEIYNKTIDPRYRDINYLITINFDTGKTDELSYLDDFRKLLTSIETMFNRIGSIDHKISLIESGICINIFRKTT